MRPLLAEAVLTVGGSFAASILAKASLAMALALIGVRLERRTRAAVRHVLLAAAFMVLLVLPIASMVAPSIQFELTRIDANIAGYPPAVARIEGPFPSQVVNATPSSARSTNSQSLGVSWVALLTWAWAGGALMFLLPVIGGLVQMRRLRRFGLPWRRGHAVVQQTAADARIHRIVEVLLHESVPGPVTCGILRPAIVLPADVKHWTHDDIKRAVVHELEHVRRGDWLMHLIARSVCALYSFHPLVWIAWRQLALEAERACDDAVLRRTEATAYADQLVTLAQRQLTTRQPLLAMAGRGDLAARVRAVLDGAQPRGRAGVMCVAATLVTAVAFVLALSPLSAVARVELPKDRAKDIPLTAVFDDRVVDITSRNPVVHRATPKGPANEIADPDVLAAQTAQASFEVASIRRSVSLASAGSMFVNPGGAFQATNISALNLISMAYRIPGSRVLDAPAWATDERYVIEARGAGISTFSEAVPLVMSLLRDRFKLVARKETRELPVYLLRVARSDGALGPRMRKADPSCLNDQLPPVKCRARFDTGKVTAGALNVANLVSTLANASGRQVLNRTGLSDFYDIDLEWAPTPDADGVSIFTAVQEQLGLRLDSATSPLDVVVVERIERPSEN